MTAAQDARRLGGLCEACARPVHAYRTGLYTTGEVAAMIGVSRRTVGDWVKKGLLASVALTGGHHRIPQDAIEAMLELRSP